MEIAPCPIAAANFDRKAVGQTRQPTLRNPSRVGRGADFAVLTDIVGLSDEGAEGVIQIGERQARCIRRLTADEIARQLGQEFAVHRAEEPFDLAAALRAPDRGEGELDV